MTTLMQGLTHYLRTLLSSHMLALGSVHYLGEAKIHIKTRPSIQTKWSQDMQLVSSKKSPQRKTYGDLCETEHVSIPMSTIFPPATD